MAGDSGEGGSNVPGPFGYLPEGMGWRYLKGRADDLRYKWQHRGRQETGETGSGVPPEGLDSPEAPSINPERTRQQLEQDWAAEPAFGFSGLEGSQKFLYHTRGDDWEVKESGARAEDNPVAWLDSKLRELPGSTAPPEPAGRVPPPWRWGDMPLPETFTDFIHRGKIQPNHPLLVALGSFDDISVMLQNRDQTANAIFLSFAEDKLSCRTQALLDEIGWHEGNIVGLEYNLKAMLHAYHEQDAQGVSEQAAIIKEAITKENTRALRAAHNMLSDRISERVPGERDEDQLRSQIRSSVDAGKLSEELKNLLGRAGWNDQTIEDLELALKKMQEARRANNQVYELRNAHLALEIVDPDTRKPVEAVTSEDNQLWLGFNLFRREAQAHIAQADELLKEAGEFDSRSYAKAAREYQESAELCYRTARYIEKSAESGVVHVEKGRIEADTGEAAGLSRRAALLYERAARYLSEIAEECEDQAEELANEAARAPEDQKSDLEYGCVVLNITAAVSRQARANVLPDFRECAQKAMQGLEDPKQKGALEKIAIDLKDEEGWEVYRAAQNRYHAHQHLKECLATPDLSPQNRDALIREQLEQRRRAIAHYEEAVQKLGEYAEDYKEKKPANWQDDVFHLDDARFKSAHRAARLNEEEARFQLEEARSQGADADTIARRQAALDDATTRREQAEAEYRSFRSRGEEHGSEQTGSSGGGGGRDGGGRPPTGRDGDGPGGTPSWRATGGDGAELPLPEKYRQMLLDAATGKEYDLRLMFEMVDRQVDVLGRNYESLTGPEFEVYNKVHRMLRAALDDSVQGTLRIVEKKFAASMTKNEILMRMLAKNVQDAKRLATEIFEGVEAKRVDVENEDVQKALRAVLSSFADNKQIFTLMGAINKVIRARDKEQAAVAMNDFLEHLQKVIDVQKILHNQDVTDEVKAMLSQYWSEFTDTFKTVLPQAMLGVQKQIEYDVQVKVLGIQQEFAIKMQKRWAIISCVSIFCGILSPSSLANTMINVGFTPLQRAIP